MMYRDYEINADMVPGMLTVCCCGDEVVFGAVDEAKQFIDEIMA